MAFWAPRRAERDREPPAVVVSGRASSSAESHEPTKGPGRPCSWPAPPNLTLWAIVPGFCSRETRFYAARRDRKSGSALSGAVCPGPREKARTGRMRCGGRESRASLPPPHFFFSSDSSGSQCAGVVSSSISSRHSVDPWTRLFGTPFSFGRERVINHTGIPGHPGHNIHDLSRS